MSPSVPAVNPAVLYFTDRLAQSLEAIETSRLTLVEAPMGYGKTVAVREYLRRRGTRVAWVPVLDAGEGAFWRDFCRALAREFPDGADIVESVARVGYPHDSVLADEIRELLLQLDFGAETVLVADDIHLLPDGGSAMVALCAGLAWRDIPNLRQVLISRNTHNARNMGRASLTVKGRLAVIDRETLALNADEIREYYALCGLDITPEQAAFLRESTGGWIGALYLHLLHWSKDGSPSPPETGDARDLRPPRRVTPSKKQGFSPNHVMKQGAPVKLINALLEEEIFRPLPETAGDLLLMLSTLNGFTAEQAEFLSGGNGGAEAVLAGLLRQNAFIALDEASGVYTLHSLFRRYLLGRFDQLPPERRKAVHSRCADWFVRCGEAVPAIEACHAAGEYERALEILESDMSRNLVTEKAAFFVDLFKSCPEPVLDRHMDAVFKYALAVFAAGDYTAFGAQLARIGRKCAERTAANGPDDPTAGIWRGGLEILLSFSAYNDIEAMSAHHRRAYELLGRPTRMFGPESPWTLGCPSVLFMFHRKSGGLDAELSLMDTCMPHYYALASNHGRGGEHQMRAEALYSRGDFSQAAVSLSLAEAAAGANGQLSILLCCMFLRLRMALLEKRYAEAEDLIGEMRGIIRKRRDFFLLHTVDLCEGWLYAAAGDPERVPEWIRFGGPEENRLYTFAGGYWYVVHGRILLLEGEYAAAAGLFTWLLQSGAFADNLLFAVYAHLYMAAANAALGLKAQADENLRAALDAALPDALYMPFAENADLLPMLKTLGRKKPYREGVRHIIRLAALSGKSPGGPAGEDLPPDASRLLSLLTRRERELVRRALTDKTYAVIAADTGLAPSTVKRAFATIHKKLGIHNRNQLAALFGKK